MGYKLKDRNRHIPNDFQILHPESGMKEPFKGSFTACMDFERNFRQKNPALRKKYGWTMDEKELDAYVESQNVARCVAHGWLNFLVSDEASPPPPVSFLAQKKTLAGAVAGHARNMAAGIGVVYEWLGPDLLPVDQETANRRAAICAECSLNQPPNLVQRIEGAIADGFKTLMEVKFDMHLETPYDSQLKTCQPCDCRNTFKVWTPIKHVLEKTAKEALSEIEKKAPACWITSEKATVALTP